MAVDGVQPPDPRTENQSTGGENRLKVLLCDRLACTKWTEVPPDDPFPMPPGGARSRISFETAYPEEVLVNWAPVILDEVNEVGELLATWDAYEDVVIEATTTNGKSYRYWLQ